MLYSAIIDNEIIPIIPNSVSKNPESNIFHADSMMLFVGPNGSGKTRILSKICEVLQENDSQKNYYYDGDISKLVVIYLTLSPFGSPSITKKDSRVQVLYRDKINSPIIPDEETFHSIAETFNLPAKISLKFKTELNNTIDTLFRNSYSTFTINNLKGPLEIIDKFDLYKKSEEESNEYRVKNNLSYSEWFESEKYLNAQKIRKNTAIFFRNFLREKLGPQFELKLRSLDMAVKGSKEAGRAYRALLGHFGLERNIETTYPAALDRFNRHLKYLSKLGENLNSIIGDKFLKKDYYEFDLEHLKFAQKHISTAYATIEMARSSSGTSALFSQFSLINQRIKKINPAADNKLLLLIDEGDVFLHMAWQQTYIKFLNNFALQLRGKFNSVQIAISTHSPVLMSDFPRDHIQKLKRIENPISNSNNKSLGISNQGSDEIISFAAPLETIIRHTGDAGTIGTFAAEYIETLIEKKRLGEIVSERELEIIDDPVLRKLVQSIKKK